MNLSKATIVSGGTSGIGRALVELLLKNRKNVIAVGRDREKLEGLERDCEELPGRLSTSVIDITKSAEADIAGEFTAICRDNEIKSLVNIVGGVDVFGTFDSLSFRDWENTFNQNLFCHLLPTKCFVDSVQKKRAKAEYNLLFLSSMAASGAGVLNPHYGCSKAAIEHLTKVLAADLGRLGFRVNCISPARLDDETLMKDAEDISRKTGRNIIDVAEEIVQNSKSKSKFQELATPHDVARVLEFLLGPCAGTISGEVIRIGGV